MPGLRSRLQRLADDVRSGRGFAVIQGVPVHGLTEEQCAVLAVGMASHIGNVVSQGVDRSRVVHVRDDGTDPARPTARSYQHRGQLGFHADPTDIVGLLCLRSARSGGHSAIVSSVAVHNALVDTHPELVGLLYDDWWFDRRTGDGPDSFYQQPIYAMDGAGRLTTRYGPDYIRSAQRGVDVPRLTAEQLRALAQVDRLNHDPRYLLTMNLSPGDLQFLNNHVILHSRTAYEDHPEPERRRHLLRLWLDQRPQARSVDYGQSHVDKQ